MGIPQHFDAMKRGVIALKDVGYFVLITLLFLSFTKIKLDNE